MKTLFDLHELQNFRHTAWRAILDTHWNLSNNKNPEEYEGKATNDTCMYVGLRLIVSTSAFVDVTKGHPGVLGFYDPQSRDTFLSGMELDFSVQYAVWRT